jgi:uncharacterized YigZ family protein
MQTNDIKKYFILDEVSTEYEIKRNRFISYLIAISDTSDVKATLKQLRIEHPKARHVCHAYLLNDGNKVTQASSDDGEPQGTAGRPMLQNLEYSNLINVLAVVVRYSSGIKLGASGLIRTYSRVVKDAIEIANLIPVTKFKKIVIEFGYSVESNIRSILRTEEVVVVSESYNSMVELIVELPEESYDGLKTRLVDVARGKIKIKDEV